MFLWYLYMPLLQTLTMISIRDNIIHSAALYYVAFMVSSRSKFICILRWGNFAVKLEVRGFLRMNDMSAFRLQVVILLGVDRKQSWDHSGGGFWEKRKMFPTFDSSSVCIVSFGGILHSVGELASILFSLTSSSLVNSPYFLKTPLGK